VAGEDVQGFLQCANIFAIGWQHDHVHDILFSLSLLLIVLGTQSANGMGAAFRSPVGFTSILASASATRLTLEVVRTMAHRRRAL
jgi:hypothetical protein